MTTPSTPSQPATKGLTALITGANRGIGFEIARQLGSEGWRVLMGCRDPERGDQSVGALAALGHDVELVEVDVSDPIAIERVRDGLDGSLDVLVNNAGVSLSGFNEDVARRTLAVNYWGPRRLTDAMLPKMTAGGRVVHVSSGMANEATLAEPLRKRFADASLNPDDVDALMDRFVRSLADGTAREQGWPLNAYRVSKLGLNALTRALARTHTNVSFTAVCPGWVRTDMGGETAPRSVEQGADGIVWAAQTAAQAESGGYFRDRSPCSW